MFKSRFIYSKFMNSIFFAANSYTFSCTVTNDNDCSFPPKVPATLSPRNCFSKELKFLHFWKVIPYEQGTFWG